MRSFKAFQVRLSQLLAVVLIISGLPVTAPAQDRSVIISFGQPNIWSLEQAHYLLARMRSQNFKLRGKELVDTDLDPNDVTGTRLESIKTMLGVGVGFNQAAGFQNNLATRELNFNQQRRHQLLGLRDLRRAELRAVNDQLAALKVERERLNADTDATDAVKKVKDTEIEQKTLQQTQLNSEVTSLTGEIDGITSPATTLATPTPPTADSTPLANSVADKLLAKDDFLEDISAIPDLNASTKLDNQLNFQYELIAKQLTQLRDEVGPGERLVFLELPQSFYTVPDKANRKLAQVWWRVEGYYEEDEKSKETRGNYVPDECREDDQGDNKLKPNPAAWRKRLGCNPYSALDRPRDKKDLLTNAGWNALSAGNRMTREDMVRVVDLIPRQSALNINEIQDKQKNFNLAGLFTWLSGIGISVDFQRERRLYEQFIQQDIYASAFGKGQSEFGWTFGPRPGTERIAPGLQTTHAILIVPEKAEAIKLRARGCFFPRKGFAPERFPEGGESRNMRCTKDDETQSTFNLVIPSTTENNFWVTGLEYRQVRPGERATVYVHGDYFSPQIGVLVNGVALRRSVGLGQVEMALPRSADGFEPAPTGDFEFVNSKLLILSFIPPLRGDSTPFKGTPRIELVTPGRARIINDLRLVVNGSYRCPEKYDPVMANCPKAKDSAGNDIVPDTPVRYKKLSEPPDLPREHSIWVRLDDQPAMFSDSSPAPVLSVDALKVFPPAPGARTFRAHLSGSKFASGDEVRINGAPVERICVDRSNQVVACDNPRSTGISPHWCRARDTLVACPQMIAPGLLEIEFPATNDPALDVTVIHRDAKNPDKSAFSAKSFPNPLALRVDRSAILEYKAEQKPRPLLKVQLEGFGFHSRLRVGAAGARVVARSDSPTTMVLDLLIHRPRRFLVLNLYDPQTNVPPIPVVINIPASEEQSEDSQEGEGQENAEDGGEQAQQRQQPTQGGGTRRPRVGRPSRTRR